MRIIDPTVEYHSPFNGTYHIIEDLGHYEDKQRKVLIRFDDSGNTQEARLYRAIKGQVRDRQLYQIDNELHHSNTCGDFIFLEDMGCMGTDHRRCKIRFLTTGYETIVTIKDAIEGRVNDPYYPSVCNFGYMGDKYTSKHPLYPIWLGMIHRCKNPSNIQYDNYGGLGVTICDRWRSFENFVDDAINLPGYEDMINSNIEYNLDKDKLQQDIPKEQRVYSPDTCCFISKKENLHLMIQEARKTGKFTSDYIGVTQEPGKNFRCCVWVNGQKISKGSYKDAVIAAHVYNNTRLFYDKNATNLNENLPPITPEEIVASRTTRCDMVKIVKPIGSIDDFINNYCS